MSLDELLLAACKGGLSHLSLSPTPSADGKKVYWRCTATPSTAHKYVSVSHEDPVAAIIEVLKTMPKAGRRTIAKGTPAQIEAPVTATVNETETVPAVDDWFNT